MDDTHLQSPHALIVTRGSELTRRKPQLLAAAYERVLPILRRPLTEESTSSREGCRIVSDTPASRSAIGA